MIISILFVVAFVAVLAAAIAERGNNYLVDLAAVAMSFIVVLVLFNIPN